MNVNGALSVCHNCSMEWSHISLSLKAALLPSCPKDIFSVHRSRYLNQTCMKDRIAISAIPTLDLMKTQHVLHLFFLCPLHNMSIASKNISFHFVQQYLFFLKCNTHISHPLVFVMLLWTTFVFLRASGAVIVHEYICQHCVVSLNSSYLTLIGCSPNHNEILKPGTDAGNISCAFNIFCFHVVFLDLFYFYLLSCFHFCTVLPSNSNSKMYLEIGPVREL